jgi:hypothetical protein
MDLIFFGVKIRKWFIRGSKKLKYKKNLCNNIIFFQTRLKYLIYLKNYNKGENIEKKKLKFPFKSIQFKNIYSKNV